MAEAKQIIHTGIQSISAKNFRKFKRLDNIALNGITYLVGGNNAGKSTVVKALRLVLENLKKLSRYSDSTNIFAGVVSIKPIFRFDITNVNIGTFEQALYRKAKYSGITFKVALSDTITITIVVEPRSANSAYALISYIRLEDHIEHCAFDIDTTNNSMQLLNMAANSKGENKQLELLRADLHNIEAELLEAQEHLNANFSQLSIEERSKWIELVALLNEKKERLTNIIEVEKKNYRSAKIDGDVLFETSIVTSLDRVNENAMIEYINGMRLQILTQNPRGYSQRTKNTGYAQILDKIMDHYLYALSRSSIEYMETHNASQKTLYTLDDRNDVTATIIHEWVQQQINPGDEEHQFVVKWMQELKIGQGFKIDNHFGEAYSVNIVYGKDSNGPQSALSELGKGAIQMMTLLLYISSMMRKYKGRNVKPLIAFEEPEQNMHPNWQSHLADIFEEVRQKGFRILVETHSEYMIRKSQVQVAQMQFADQDDLNENCPISTYYFPTEEKPYKMEYRPTGGFAKLFDEGFFDEAAKWDMVIMQNEWGK